MALRMWSMPLLAASIVVGAAASAPAQERAPGAVTAGALGDLCAASEPTAIAFCRGFLIGAGQYHASVTRGPGGTPPVFCLNEAAMPTVEQAQAAFAAWARANPQHAAERAVDGLTRWAAEAYPCPAPAPVRARR